MDVDKAARDLRLAFGELGQTLFFTGQRVVPQRLQQLGFAFKFPELEPALRAVVRR